MYVRSFLCLLLCAWIRLSTSTTPLKFISRQNTSGHLTVGPRARRLSGPAGRCGTRCAVRADLIERCRRIDRSFFFETSRRWSE